DSEDPQTSPWRRKAGADRANPYQAIKQLEQDLQREFLPRLWQLYRNDPDSGIHGASEWLLRQWQFDEELKKTDEELATGKVEGQRHWYVNRQGQTMMVVAKSGEFWVGRNRQMWIDRSFALASKEVTVEQFLRFRMNHPFF